MTTYLVHTPKDTILLQNQLRRSALRYKPSNLERMLWICRRWSWQLTLSQWQLCDRICQIWPLWTPWLQTSLCCVWFQLKFFCFLRNPDWTVRNSKYLDFCSFSRQVAGFLRRYDFLISRFFGTVTRYLVTSWLFSSDVYPLSLSMITLPSISCSVTVVTHFSLTNHTHYIYTWNWSRIIFVLIIVVLSSKHQYNKKKSYRGNITSDNHIIKIIVIINP